MEYQCINGLRSTFGRSYLATERTPRRGNKPIAQGIALGYQEMPTFALKGQKHNRDESPMGSAFALSGRGCYHRLPRALPWAIS